ncbi:hypothetical protein B0J14DRAFT_662192 [Halenospora varia]|nr:hypothetical protein B0J14DRAFT_662192 [Halenospora varia]
MIDSLNNGSTEDALTSSPSSSEVENLAISSKESTSDISALNAHNLRSASSQHEEHEISAQIPNKAKEEHSDFVFPTSFDEFCPFMQQDPKWKYYSEDSHWTIVQSKTSSLTPKPRSSIYEYQSRPIEILWPLSDTLETGPSTMGQTFTRFSELPTELRLKIWKFALPHPRVLNATRRFEVVTAQEYDNPFGQRHLFACHESSNVFKKAYCKLQFHGSCESEQWDYKKICEYYFDFRRDTVCLDIQNMLWWLHQGLWLDISSIQHLALSGFESITDAGDSLYTLLELLCPKLRSLSLVLRENIAARGPTHDLTTATLRLIPITRDLPLSVQFNNRGSSCSTTRRALDEIYHRGKHLHDAFQNDLLKDPDFWKYIEVNVSISAYSKLSTQEWYKQRLWLVPKVKFPYHQYFVTYRPAILDESIETMFIYEQDNWSSKPIYLRDGKDGQLETIYDGIQNLFNEEFHSIERQKDDGWAKYDNEGEKKLFSLGDRCHDSWNPWCIVSLDATSIMDADGSFHEQW